MGGFLLIFRCDQALLDSNLINNRINYASKVATTDERLDKRDGLFLFTLLHHVFVGLFLHVGSCFPDFLLEHDLVDVVRFSIHSVDRDHCIDSPSKTTASDESLDNSSTDFLSALV